MASYPDYVTVPSSLESEIEAEIESYGANDLTRLDAAYGNYVVKYVPPRYSKQLSLHVSTTPGFTWGTATYVAHFENPLSSAIFGRAGLVAAYDATGWRIFDVRKARSQRLYLQWLMWQPLYSEVLLTTHSAFYNQLLRDRFKTHYRIDCVLFNPDQFNRFYTRSLDTWMAVSDFDSSGRLKTDDSTRFRDVRFTVVVAEEFASPDPNVAITLDTLMGPINPRPIDVAAARSEILNAYLGHTIAYTRL